LTSDFFVFDIEVIDERWNTKRKRNKEGVGSEEEKTGKRKSKPPCFQLSESQALFAFLSVGVLWLFCYCVIERAHTSAKEQKKNKPPEPKKKNKGRRNQHAAHTLISAISKRLENQDKPNHTGHHA
jgi:hypothetical protein